MRSKKANVCSRRRRPRPAAVRQLLPPSVRRRRPSAPTALGPVALSPQAVHRKKIFSGSALTGSNRRDTISRPTGFALLLLACPVGGPDTSRRLGSVKVAAGALKKIFSVPLHTAAPAGTKNRSAPEVLPLRGGGVIPFLLAPLIGTRSALTSVAFTPPLFKRWALWGCYKAVTNCYI